MPRTFDIAVIQGDGIGPEVVASSQRVLDTVATKWKHTFRYASDLVGGSAIDAYGTPLKDETIAAAKKADNKRVMVPAANDAQHAAEVFSAYQSWQFSEEATTKCTETILPGDASTEERGWFEALFHVLVDTAKMDKEWLLLLAADHSLFAAASVLIETFGAKGTAPVEGDKLRRVANEQTTAHVKLQKLLSSLGSFLGRFKIRTTCTRRGSATTTSRH